MDQQINLSAVEQKVAQLIETKQATDISKNRIEEPRAPTMIEEAKMLREQLTKLRDEIKTERTQLDEVHAQAMLGGRSLQGKVIEKSKEETAWDNARDILKIYGK